MMPVGTVQDDPILDGMFSSQNPSYAEGLEK